MRKRAPRMRKLTMILLRWSTEVIEGRNRLTVADSDKLLERGTAKFSQFWPLLDSMLPPENLDGETELPRYSTELGVAHNIDSPEYCQRRSRSIMRDREN
jgi:hypothetical protein